MSTSFKTFPIWAFFSLLTNGVLLLAVVLLIWQQQKLTAFFGLEQMNVNNSPPVVTPDLGRRHQLTYQQWVDILKQEAKVAADRRPVHLTILAGDSLSLWFPTELLPEGKNWLNQGISGETSQGLLKRLNIFDRTKPEAIFVMIGINDLIRGTRDEVILNNHQQIITHLRRVHPTAEIVVQSILPHGAEQATWQGRDKLLAITNNRIRRLNERLRSISAKQGVKFLDLYPLFTNTKGNLRQEFTTDGLHLNREGYIVWRSALQIYSNIELKPELQRVSGKDKK
ncbi:MAG: SGNH/GDSL hydrolase family protein [Nostoc sp. ZfuVER08]|uniref:G-D-S-L family lipolytic protein n=1 Tax=Nostoc punctiforme FACHB-252 TaxID=1357509 RepID=A0ABR8H285_NOSPU|nr:GDSL-type esterase/lipase family protein [Nostoc punctiforme]MBD2609941.1 G-D-S-L family lipolytic protein [Nostoc punctiforme FACHB-252]MBL1199922.1 G-D-S-L family lipolytic protein [Nostoc sp. GBBB01]MDZ8015758.1 SGNH/GDSL hydrolase family protein [Nostoc sp. ZfuVER08]